MTNVHTTFKGGHRFYADDSTKVTVPGVTSIIGTFPKPFLTPWATKLTAELAMDSIDFLSRLDRTGAVAYLKDASKRYTKEAAQKGSDAHDAFERMMRGESVNLSDVPEHAHPHIAHFREFLDVVQPAMVAAEDIAWHDGHGYAGSFDLIATVRIDPERKVVDRHGDPVNLIIDYKTGKSTYPDVAMQLTAYAMADRYISADGASYEPPEINGGAVLHVTEAGWAFKSVQLGDAPWCAFLAALNFFRANQQWQSVAHKHLGKPLAKSQGRLVTGTERRS